MRGRFAPGRSVIVLPRSARYRQIYRASMNRLRPPDPSLSCRRLGPRNKRGRSRSAPEGIGRSTALYVGQRGLPGWVNRRPRPRIGHGGPGVRPGRLAAPSPTVALEIGGTSRGDLAVVPDELPIDGGYFYGPVPRGICLLQVQGTSRGPALLTWGWVGPGMTGLLGIRPRPMSLRAAPGGSSGPRRVPPEPSATRNRCCMSPGRRGSSPVIHH
jgi:hypothetical protein